MYEASGQDNIAGASIQTYKVIETSKLKVWNQNEIQVA